MEYILPLKLDLERRQQLDAFIDEDLISVSTTGSEVTIHTVSDKTQSELETIMDKFENKVLNNKKYNDDEFKLSLMQDSELSMFIKDPYYAGLTQSLINQKWLMGNLILDRMVIDPDSQGTQEKRDYFVAKLLSEQNINLDDYTGE